MSTEQRSSAERAPIVYRVPGSLSAAELPPAAADEAGLRVWSRALQGMQKEALVHYGPTGVRWRMLCDEGPWLNGTDLAPFPLGYFSAGLAATAVSDFIAEARDRELALRDPRCRLDLFLRMEGSALAGTMQAHVDTVRLAYGAGGPAAAAELSDIAEVSLIDRGTAAVALQAALPSRFALRVNGRDIQWPGSAAEHMITVPDPATLLESLSPDTTTTDHTTIVHKAAEAGGASSAAGVGLQSSQKRIVHVQAGARLRRDGLKEIAVRCVRPAGSTFVCLSDEPGDAGGRERAPCGLAYLSAGVAFCFMTQIGRYAEISKQGLRGYRVVQDTVFRRGRPYGPAASPVSTLVCLESEEPDEHSLSLVRMGEQTCYLHAAFRERCLIETQLKEF